MAPLSQSSHVRSVLTWGSSYSWRCWCGLRQLSSVSGPSPPGTPILKHLSLHVHPQKYNLDLRKALPSGNARISSKQTEGPTEGLLKEMPTPDLHGLSKLQPCRPHLPTKEQRGSIVAVSQSQLREPILKHELLSPSPKPGKQLGTVNPLYLPPPPLLHLTNMAFSLEMWGAEPKSPPNRFWCNEWQGKKSDLFLLFMIASTKRKAAI